MRAVPISWMHKPGALPSSNGVTSFRPAAWSISTAEAFISLRIASSFSFHSQSNVTVGWPHLSRFVAIGDLVGHAGGADLEMMIHQVVPEFATIVAEAIRETVRGGVQQNGGRGDRRGAAENYARVELDRLVRLRIDDPHAGRTLL